MKQAENKGAYYKDDVTNDNDDASGNDSDALVKGIIMTTKIEIQLYVYTNTHI